MSIKSKQRKKFRILLFSALLLTFSGTICYASSIQPHPYTFNLYYGTDNDNEQIKGSRLNYGYSEYDQYLSASIGISSQTNAYQNFYCKQLKVSEANGSLTVATTSGTKPSSSNTITIYYLSDYIQNFGLYNLYGWSTKSNCYVNGIWFP